MTRLNAYSIVPWILLSSLFLSAVFSVAIRQHKKQINSKQQILTKNIKAANISTRTICHYMKNQILAIEAEVEELVDDPTDAEVKDRVLSRIDSTYQKLDLIHRSTSDNVLNLSLVKAINVVNASIQDILKDAQMKNITIEKKGFDLSDIILCDPVLLQQAFYEVLKNAIDAMEFCNKKILTIEITREYNSLRVSIRDTGVGIPDTELDRIYNPMYSSKPTGRNWGLGLTLAYQIITAHNGIIKVLSTVNFGTEVIINLPIRDYEY